jgi:hypothetical protein
MIQKDGPVRSSIQDRSLKNTVPVQVDGPASSLGPVLLNFSATGPVTTAPLRELPCDEIADFVPQSWFVMYWPCFQK